MAREKTKLTANPTEIAIRVRTIGQLFNSFDPSPFREKDLDTGVEEFLVGWVRELPPTAPFRIVVHLPAEEAAKPEAPEIGAAFAHYFQYRAQASARELRELLRIGWRSFFIGAIVLIVCLVASQIAAKAIANVTVARVVEESLIIVGWVANWRPIEIYLYDWWPIVRRARVYRRIAAAHVRVKAG
jgi:ABC-type spermidine/putrescine transport system permease subunit I